MESSPERSQSGFNLHSNIEAPPPLHTDDPNKLQPLNKIY